MAVSHNKSALVVRGGWEGHEPVATTDLFIPFLAENGFDVQVVDSPEVYLETNCMLGVDLIVQSYSMGVVSNAAITALRASVESGTGLAGWHGGIVDSFRNSSDYLQLIGGQFANHPGKDSATIAKDGPENNYVRHMINISDEHSDHSIVAGIKDFELETEQYWVLSDDYNDILATTTQQARPFDQWNRPITSPAIWTRQWGAGRIFVATPGHTVDVLESEPVNTIVKRGLLWASR